MHQAAPALAEKSLDRELDGLRPSKPKAETSSVVNDLSSMVVKKKKLPDAGKSGSAMKRSADDDVEGRNNEKKSRVESA